MLKTIRLNFALGAYHLPYAQAVPRTSSYSTKPFEREMETQLLGLGG